MSKFLTYSYFVAPLCLALSHPAWAQDASEFKWSAGYTVQNDSNLFRLPANANTAAVLGKSSGAEQIGTSTLGLGVHVLSGLQTVDLSASIVDYNYQNFQYLSFTASNYDFAWRWALTPRFTGSLTSDRKETLNSFSDYQGYNVRNEHLETSTSVDGVYEVDGPWRVLGGIGQVRQTNQKALVAGDDFSSTAVNAGLRYAFASGSTMTYKLIASDGAYDNRVLTPALLLDDHFRELAHDFRLHWMVSDRTAADANVTYINRTHPTFSQRDYGGFNIGASLNWALSGKTTLLLAYARELGSYATANSNYSQTDRITIGPAWQISAKTRLALRTVWSQVDYQGSPTATASSQRRDTTRDTTLSLNWQPRERWTFTTSLQNLSRGSSISGLDYDSNVASLSALYSY